MGLKQTHNLKHGKTLFFISVWDYSLLLPAVIPLQNYISLIAFKYQTRKKKFKIFKGGVSNEKQNFCMNIVPNNLLIKTLI